MICKPERRTLKTVALVTGLVVVGGGLAGVCAAITAARTGHTLRYSRPVVTACLEIRLVVPRRNVPAALFEVRRYAD